MPAGRNYRYRRRPRVRRRRKKYQPKNVMYKKNAKYQLANKVELIRPITLKPKSVMKKFIFYNIAEVSNDTIGGVQNAQHVTFYLNSPWILNNDTYATQGGNQWNWNNPMTVHVNGSAPTTGTSYPGMFEANGIGNGYQDACIVGTKVTISGSSLFRPNRATGDPCALFAVVNSQASTALSQLTTIDELYASPYCQVRRIAHGGTNSGDLSGNVKDASITLKYSPKRFNNIKDIRDNHGFFSHVSQDLSSANHPSELDRVTFGIVNCMSNPATHRGAGTIMLQVKQEVTVLFSEPFNNRNQFPAIPAGAAAAAGEFAGGVANVML